MDEYNQDFASLYDRLIYEDINYSEMADYIESCFTHMGAKPSLVLDMACGTGSLTSVLAKRGYDMIGLDVSCDMLNIAREKNGEVLYLCQDMRELDLYGTVDGVVCMTDSLNYITDYEDLCKVFKLVKNFLNPGAPFIFDMSSHYKLSHVIANNTFTYDSENISYIWENEYSERLSLCNFFLTFFVSRDGETYRRFDEHQTQRAYTTKEVLAALAAVGFTDTGVYDGYSFDAPKKESERIVYTAR